MHHWKTFLSFVWRTHPARIFLLATVAVFTQDIRQAQAETENTPIVVRHDAASGQAAFDFAAALRVADRSARVEKCRARKCDLSAMGPAPFIIDMKERHGFVNVFTNYDGDHEYHEFLAVPRKPMPLYAMKNRVLSAALKASAVNSIVIAAGNCGDCPSQFLSLGDAYFEVSGCYVPPFWQIGLLFRASEMV